MLCTTTYVYYHYIYGFKWKLKVTVLKRGDNHEAQRVKEEVIIIVTFHMAKYGILTVTAEKTGSNGSQKAVAYKIFI